jgi:hypothetical protein
MHMSSTPSWLKKKPGNLEAIFAGGFRAREPEQDDKPERLGSWTSYALTYAAMGWPIIPLHTVTDGCCSCGNPACSSPGKHPRTRNGLHDASTDRATILGWGERWPDSNLAIVTGSASGVWALDVDARHGGLDTLADLIDRHGPLPDTLMAITGGGGQHWLFRYAEGVRNRAGIAPGIDVRGEGGYIAVEPSVHASGNAYAWEASSDPTDGVAPVPAPEWLMAMVVAEAPRQAAPVAAGAIAEGGRNNALASLAGTMRRAGMSREAIESALVAENDRRCVPPLSRQEVERIAWSISRKEPEQDYGELAQVDVSALIQSLKDQTTERTEGFKLRPVTEILHQQSIGWLIRGFLPRGSVALLFGDAAAGKSLQAIEWAACVALGRKWRGRKVAQGPVVFIAGEGHAGLPARFKAWEIANGAALPDCLHVSTTGAAFLDQRSAAAVVDAVAALPEAPAMVVIDTLHANFGAGDENSASDMGAFLAGIRRLHDVAPDAVLLIVHHPGHGDKTRARGSYALHGALDAEYRLELDGELRILSCTKPKDFERPEPVRSELSVVELPWLDEDGQPISAPVLSATDLEPQREKVLADGLRVAFAALLEASSAQPGANWHGANPKPELIVTRQHWRAAFENQHHADSQETRRKAFNRAVKELHNGGAVGAWQDTFWPTPEAGIWPELVGMVAAKALLKAGKRL